MSIETKDGQFVWTNGSVVVESAGLDQIQFTSPTRMKNIETPAASLDLITKSYVEQGEHFAVLITDNSTADAAAAADTYYDLVCGSSYTSPFVSTAFSLSNTGVVTYTNPSTARVVCSISMSCLSAGPERDDYVVGVLHNAARIAEMSCVFDRPLLFPQNMTLCFIVMLQQNDTLRLQFKNVVRPQGLVVQYLQWTLLKNPY